MISLHRSKDDVQEIKLNTNILLAKHIPAETNTQANNRITSVAMQQHCKHALFSR
jgi:hypothetical protein